VQSRVNVAEWAAYRCGDRTMMRAGFSFDRCRVFKVNGPAWIVRRRVERKKDAWSLLAGTLD